MKFGEHRLLFRPRDSYDQRLLDSSLIVVPEPTSVRWIHDVFGNCVAVLKFAQPAKSLEFDCRMQIDHTPQQGPDFQIDRGALNYPFAYGSDEAADLAATVRRHYQDDPYRGEAERTRRSLDLSMGRNKPKQLFP